MDPEAADRRKARLVWRIGTVILVVAWTSLIWAGLLGLPVEALWLTWVAPGALGVILHQLADRMFIRAGGEPMPRLFRENFFGGR